MEIKPNVVYWCKTKEIAEWFVEEYNKNQPISKQITLDIKLYDKYKDFLFVGNKEYFKEKTFYEIVDVEPFYEKECRLKNVEEALKVVNIRLRDENNNCKSTNTILEELSEVWEDIKANKPLERSIVGLLLGKRDEVEFNLNKQEITFSLGG